MSRKALKIPLKSILKNDLNYDKFYDVIYRSNDIIFICYTFIHAYILYLFNGNKDIPAVNRDFIRMAFKVLSKQSKGPKPKGNNKLTFNILNKFYADEFVYVILNKNKDIGIDDYCINESKFNSTNLSYIINCFEDEMETMITNNIKFNFCKYVYMYVDSHFLSYKVKRLSKEKFNALTDIKKAEHQLKLNKQIEKNKIIAKEIFKVKNDLFDSTNTSDQKYTEWIKENKKIIFPKLENSSFSYEDDLSVNCFKYLEKMLMMNRKLEHCKSKLFSVLPMRTGLMDKYVTFNTSSLKDIFKDVNSGLSNDAMWKKYFNINLKKLKIKDHEFNFQISTDGYSTSINFIHKNDVEKKNKKSIAMNKGSQLTKKLLNGKTNEERNKIIKELNETKAQNKIKRKEEGNKIKKEKKEEFKKLSKDDQDRIKLQKKIDKNKFEYIEDAIKNDIIHKELKKAFDEGLIKPIDPGLRAPMTILGKGEKRKNKTGKQRKDLIMYSYSSGARINGLKRLQYGKLIKNKKNKTHINGTTLKKLEENLSKYNSKTVNYNKFVQFAKCKIALRKSISMNSNLQLLNDLKVNQKGDKFMELVDIKCKNSPLNTNNISDNEHKIILDHIKNNINKKEIRSAINYNKYTQKLRWFSYINKQRHECNILNDIEDVYGKNSIFVVGDWSAKSKIRRISMPNMGMKKLLEKRFKVYLIDEYNTSSLSWQTKEKTENAKIKITIKKGGEEETLIKKLYAVLSSKMSKSTGLINRDYNALQNMNEIIKSLIYNKKRPECFTYNKKAVTMEQKMGKGCKGAKEALAYRVAKNCKIKDTSV